MRTIPISPVCLAFVVTLLVLGSCVLGLGAVADLVWEPMIQDSVGGEMRRVTPEDEERHREEVKELERRERERRMPEVVPLPGE